MTRSCRRWRWHMKAALSFLAAIFLGGSHAVQGNPDPSALSGTVEIESLEPTAEEAAAMEALRKNPGATTRRALAKIRIERAMTLSDQSQREGNADTFVWALDYAQSATELAPDAAPYWLMAGFLYSHIPNNPHAETLAEEALKKALKLDADINTAHLLLGQLYYRQQKFDGAIDELEIALAADTSLVQPVIISSLGWAYVLGKQVDRGETFFRSLTKKEATAGTAQIALACFLQGMGKSEEAKTLLKGVMSNRKALKENRDYARQLLDEWRAKEKP